MAELSIKQITDKINELFAKDEGRRQLVFWYDDNKDFEEDVTDISLQNAKLLVMKPNEQFKIKLLLERQDKNTNYLIYAPFPKPPVQENYLEDTLLYSKRFYADRLSLVMYDLNIPETYKSLLESHSHFFGNKTRTKRFYDLNIEYYTKESIVTGMICAICKNRICSFDEALKTVLISKENGTDLLNELAKYKLDDAFWKLCEKKLGYAGSNLNDLITTLFVTDVNQYIPDQMPKEWMPYLSGKQGSVTAFLESMMNNVKEQQYFDRFSEKAARRLDVKGTFCKMAPETLLDIDCFKAVDDVLLAWMNERLLSEDIGAKLDGHTIPEICDMRSKSHFGKGFHNDYALMRCAHAILSDVRRKLPQTFKELIDIYQNELYQIDANYRHFYENIDKVVDRIEDNSYDKLRTLVENVYTNDYLGKLLPSWNRAFLEEGALRETLLQRDFYRKIVSNMKEKVVVIISDAMRYEVGQELFLKLQDNPKSDVKIEPMLSTLPSYTRLGMSAMLPHKSLTLTITDDGKKLKELVDGHYCTDLTSREKVLKAEQPDACCVQFDAVKNINRDQLRDLFNGKQVIYVYHDQIDVRGENAEDEIFAACKEAVDEIAAFVENAHNRANIYRFIVTADHGFIYKREKVKESGKISISETDGITKRRYIVSNHAIKEDGVANLSLDKLLDNDDQKIVSFPIGPSVFKVPGSGGQNYVHGGSSPQEMLIPLITIKMERGKAETTTAKILLVSLIHKITSSPITLDFIQADAISDSVKPTTYRIVLIDQDGNAVSNEILYTAGNRNPESNQRLFRLQFALKEQRYEMDKPYYLIAVNAQGEEVIRHLITIDIPFVD